MANVVGVDFILAHLVIYGMVFLYVDFWNFKMSEVWKDIDGYGSSYRVSSFGRLASIRRVITDKNGVKKSISGRLMKQAVGNHGYKVVSLWLKGKKSVRTTHSLVAEAFIGPRPEGLEVCHDDGDQLNNCATNLRYDTISANRLDCVKHGTSVIHLQTGSGEKNPASKLTELEVLEIRANAPKRTGTLKDFAKSYPHVSYSLIKRVVRRELWSHV